MVTTTADSIAAHTKYEPVIGLEVHVQLLTETKIFCCCSTQFRRSSEHECLPGLPGHARSAARAEPEGRRVRGARGDGAELPDQRDFDLCAQELLLSRPAQGLPDFAVRQAAGRAWLHRDQASDGSKKKIGITRVHLEEDAGKSLHDGFPDCRRQDLHRPQPLRRAADRNRQRARHRRRPTKPTNT